MRRNLGIALATILLSVALAVPTMAAPLVGTRAMAMGGASTAVVNDATAPYWNPAGMALHKFALTSGLFGQTDVSALGPVFGSLGNIDFDQALSGSYDVILEQLLAGLASSVSSDPMYLKLNMYTGITCKWVGLTAFATGDGYMSGQDVVVDPNTGNMTSGTATATSDAVATANATLALQFKRIPGIKWVSVGGSLKAVAAASADVTLSVDTTTGDQLVESTVGTATGFAGDAGLMVQIVDWARVGVVVKDIGWSAAGSLTTTYPDGTTSTSDWLSIRPLTMNVGLGFFPIKGMTLAADCQGINLTNISDTTGMTANLGFEQVLGPLALRLGGLAEFPGAEPLYTVTGGFGLKLGAFRWDLSALYQVTDGQIGAQSLIALQW